LENTFPPPAENTGQRHLGKKLCKDVEEKEKNLKKIIDTKDKGKI
jgi:hypothetical protein